MHYTLKIETDTQTRKLMVWFVIQMIRKIYTTLCCSVQHTKKREVKESDKDILGHLLFNRSTHIEYIIFSICLY